LKLDAGVKTIFYISTAIRFYLKLLLYYLELLQTNIRWTFYTVHYITMWPICYSFNYLRAWNILFLL